MTLFAKKFFKDPDVETSLSMLLQKLGEHQKVFSGPKPADVQKTQSYQETIEAFSKIRAGQLYYPYLSSGLGQGVFIELGDGSIKYDFIIGIGVHLLGHSHPKIIEACLKASLRDTVMQGNLQQDELSYEFSKLLLDTATKNGAKLSHCFLTSSGVMANENGLKIAFQKNTPKDRILAFEKCFMGRTLALSQITDKPAFREGLPITYKIDYLPFFDASCPKESIQKTLSVLKKYLDQFPNQHAVMCFELVQGEAGFHPGSHEFFVAIMHELKKQGIAILVDEIQTFGRLSEPFAFQHFNLDDYVDIVTVGKATQVCATLFTENYRPKPGLLSQTFTGSTTAIASGKVVIEELIKNNHFGKNGKNQKMFVFFESKLKEIEKRHPDLIKGPYGIGGMIAFTPFDGTKEKTTSFIKKLFDNGVLAFTAGDQPTRTRFLLPLGVITEKDINAVCEIVEKTLLECRGHP